MKVDILTIFPDFFRGPLDYGIVRRAREAGLVDVEINDLRAFAHDRHRTVDDRPFGGGEGMVLKPEPIFECLEALKVHSWEDRVAGGTEQSVVGNLVGSWTDLYELVQIHAKGRLKLRTETHTLNSVNDVLDKLREGEVTGTGRRHTPFSTSISAEGAPCRMNDCHLRGASPVTRCSPFAPVVAIPSTPSGPDTSGPVYLTGHTHAA